MITEEIRSYEVSLWTLQDEFITVLKWSDVEQKGRIQDPEMVINVDGTETFNFRIPMYLENYIGLGYTARREVIENPIWYNTKNGNLMEGVRKIKVIFNKDNPLLPTTNKSIITYDDLVNNPTLKLYIDWRKIYKNYIPPDYKGNVDLFNRKIIPQSSFTEDNKYPNFSGDYGTLYSMSRTIDNKEYLFTPIKSDGTVLSTSEITSYFNVLGGTGLSIEDADAQNSRLILCSVNDSDFSSLAEAIEYCDRYGEVLHELLAEWDIIRYYNNWFGDDTIDSAHIFSDEPKLYSIKLTNQRNVFEFLINKITEEHQLDLLFCKVQCDGLAFNELGKIGYKINLSQDNFMANHKEWAESNPHQWTKPDGTKSSIEPRESIDYWCELCGLIPYDFLNTESKKWYYKVEMNWKSFEGVTRSSDKIYEELYVTSWSDNLVPLHVESAREKERPVSANESNLYNITQTIAETFRVYCRYEYGYDENYHIISRTIVFYNNFLSEEEDNISLIYPYTSSSVSRDVDSSNLTTKMFVRSSEDSTILGGTINIMDSPANKTGEDYLLNFDYMYKVGAITQELYDAITEFEKSIHTINNQINSLSLLLSGYNSLKIDTEAEILVLNRSIEIAQEQEAHCDDLYNRIDSDSGDADGYFERKADNCYSTLAKFNQESNIYYIDFNDLDKGLKEDSIHIYKTYRASLANEADKLINPVEVTDYVSDKYGDIIRANLNVTFTTNESKKLYIIYKYAPTLYYETVKNTWVRKREDDEERLGKDASEDGTEEATGLKKTLADLNEAITTTENSYNSLIILKKTMIREFEEMMGPALREGYWQSDSYNDYGELKSTSTNLPSTYIDGAIKADAGDSVIINWDNELFDDEEKIYYEEGVTKDKCYYPCIDISSYYSLIKTMMNSSEGKLAFVFNNNYYKDLTAEERNKLLNISNFTINSKMHLGFIHIGTTIKPVLVLTGTKNMTDDEIKFMFKTRANNNDNGGDPRLCIFSTGTSGENVTVSIVSSIPIALNEIYWDSSKIDGVNDITDAETIYPRVKFSDMRLKTSEDTLHLSYGTESNLLKRYNDYLVLNRTTLRNNLAFLECFITIKPEVFVNAGTYSGTLYAKYMLSNAATNILLDATEILKENSEPKVSYQVLMSVLDKNLLKILYTMLARVVKINDVDLKFDNVLGYISSMTLKLDKPWEDTIEVKNYKTKFEDLFSTIVALTEAMKKTEGLYGAALDGSIALSEDALLATLANNLSILNSFLDSHFDTSQVVKDRLASLFEEAGKILSSSNDSLNTIRELSVENAEILGGFVQDINSELTPRVFNQVELPTTFKVGDVWNKIDATTHTVIGRYVATASSEDANGGGWTRTFDGSIASIKGANLDIDTVAGTIDIKAENKINLATGGYLSLTGSDVDIVGNNSVHISGVTVNIDSVEAGGETYSPAGINLLSSSTIANSLSKILLSPTEINMAGANIYMKGGKKILSVASDGTANGTSAVQISTTDGIWIGSGNGIKLFAGGSFNYNDNTKTLTAATGANVELNSTHLILGYSTNNNAQVIEMKNDYLVIASGNIINSSNPTDTGKITTGITGTSSGLVGAKFTKDSIGLATSYTENNTTKYNAILMNNLGITVGSGSVDVTAADLTSSSGSYVRISGTGVELGSLADLYINTNNFKLLTNYAATANTLGTTILAVGTNLNNINSNTNVNSLNSTSTVTFLVNNSGAFINGYIYAAGGSFTGAVHASSFELTGNAMPVSYIDSTGLNSAISSNNTVSTAASNAATALSKVDPIDVYGMIGFDSSKANTTGYDSSGWPTHHSTSYGLILGNSLTLPMLIGSNGGIHIVNTGKTGSAVIIDENGIDIASGGYLKVDTTNVKINPVPANNGDYYFYVGDSNNYVAYKKDSTNTLEIKGAVTATSFILSSPNNYSLTKYWVINTSSTAYTDSTDDATWTAWATTAPDLSSNLGKYLHTKTINSLGGQSKTIYDVVYISLDGQNGLDGSSYSISGLSTIGWGSGTTVKDQYVSITSTGGLLLGANNGIVIPRVTPVLLDDNENNDETADNTDTIVEINSSHINLDYYDNNGIKTSYIHMDSLGLAVDGLRISIGGNPVWARDDIVIMNSNLTEYILEDGLQVLNPEYWRHSVESIESHMGNNAHDWVLIKPYYNAITYLYPADSSSLSKTRNSKSYIFYGSFSNIDNISFGNGAETYSYQLNSLLYVNYSSSTPTGSGRNVSTFTVELANQDFNDQNTIAALTFDVASGGADYIGNSGDSNGYTNSGNVLSLSLTTGGNTGTNPLNLCGDGSIIYYKINIYLNTSAHDVKLEEFNLVASCDATKSRVPCTVYYYP